MPLNLNNQNDGYYNNVFVLNPSTALYQEIRDLITEGGGSGGAVNSVTLPMSIDSMGVLSINLSGYTLSFQVLTNMPTNALFTDTLYIYTLHSIQLLQLPDYKQN